MDAPISKFEDLISRLQKMIKGGDDVNHSGGSTASVSGSQPP